MIVLLTLHSFISWRYLPTWLVSKFHQLSSFRPNDTPGGLLASLPLPTSHLVHTSPFRDVALPIRPVLNGGRLFFGSLRLVQRPWYHMTYSASSESLESRK